MAKVQTKATKGKGKGLGHELPPGFEPGGMPKEKGGKGPRKIANVDHKKLRKVSKKPG